MTTRVNSGTGGGTIIQPGAQGTNYDALDIAIRPTTAVYPAAPTDLGTPTVDRLILALYSTGKYLMWSYDLSAAKWVMWTEGAAVA